MVLDPFNPAFYERTNQILVQTHQERLAVIAEDWQDEAAEAALAGNPYRARYLETQIAAL